MRPRPRVGAGSSPAGRSPRGHLGHLLRGLHERPYRRTGRRQRVRGDVPRVRHHGHRLLHLGLHLRHAAAGHLPVHRRACGRRRLPDHRELPGRRHVREPLLALRRSERRRVQAIPLRIGGGAQALRRAGGHGRQPLLPPGRRGVRRVRRRGVHARGALADHRLLGARPFETRPCAGALLGAREGGAGGLPARPGNLPGRPRAGGLPHRRRAGRPCGGRAPDRACRRPRAESGPRDGRPRTAWRCEPGGRGVHGRALRGALRLARGDRRGGRTACAHLGRHHRRAGTRDRGRGRPARERARSPWPAARHRGRARGAAARRLPAARPADPRACGRALPR